MTSIKDYKTTRGEKRYMVLYRTPDRRSTKKRGFKTKRAAEDWAANNTVQMNTGSWRPEKAGRVTVNAAVKEWLKVKSASIAPGTQSNYTGGVKNIARVTVLGETYLKDVTPELIEEWASELSKLVKPKTVRNAFGVLNGTMKRAVRDRRIATNPCEGVVLPRVEKNEMVVPTVDDVERIADAAGDFGDFVRFLAMTGLRWGELAGLQVQDVNLETGRLYVRRQITEANGKLVHRLPKHGKRRIVPLVEQAAQITASRIEGKGLDDLVFTTKSGAVLRNQNARRDWLDEAVKSAGLEGVTPHDFRHTFASVAIAAGANVKALQQALGHHSAAFTLDQYGHLFPDDLAGFVNVMAASFR